MSHRVKWFAETERKWGLVVVRNAKTRMFMARRVMRVRAVCG